MQRISRAPELSATLSLDSCWIIALPRLLHHVDQAPALGLGERPGLDHADDVAFARLVALVVRVQLGRAADDLLVGPVPAGGVDADGDRFVALAGDDDSLPHLGRIRLALGRRGAGARGALRLRGLALLATQVRPDPSFLGSLRRALLGIGRIGLARLPAGSLQPQALLPGKIVLGVGLGRSLFGGRGLNSFLGGSLLGGRRLLSDSGLLSCRGLLRGLSRGGLLDRLLGLGLLSRLVFFSLVVAHIRRVSFSTSMPRWRATVSSRAMSFFACPSRALFSSSPVACRKRRLKASCLASISFATSSSSFRLCASAAFITRRLPRASRIWFSPEACGPPGAALRAPAPRGRRPARTSPCRA